MNELSQNLLVASYEKLRDEIHQRVDQRQQLLTYTMIGAASFFSIGLQSWASAVTVLSYPALAFFLALAWAQHDTRIGQIVIYLRDIEDRFLPGLGWERYRRDVFTKKKYRLSDSVSLPARGLFIGSQLLALLIGLARFLQGPQMIAEFVFLMIVDGLVILVTMSVLTHRRSRVVSTQKGMEVQA
jgi:hypothetical protein